MDDKCRRQPAGRLDDVFGIERSGEEKPQPLGLTLEGVSDPLKIPAGEATVRAKGATARGRVAGTEVPVFLRNRFGRGRAAFLNVNLAEFENERRFATPTERGLRQAMLALLAECGVRPRYPVTLESGKVPHIEVVRYAAGPLEYVGLLRSMVDEGGEVAKVALGQPRHVYDVRSGKYLGKVATITAPLLPGDCRVYGLAPAPLGKVSLRASTTAQPGEPVQFRLSLAPGMPGERQLVRITALRPDGTEAPDYARNYLLGPSPIQGTVHLALNDPPGPWRLRARSLCTGQAVEGVVRVGRE
jgi:hypothetical protein